MKPWILVALILGWLCGVASATEYFVDPEVGDDANNGRRETPWRSLERALQQLNETGGTLYLAPGARFRETLKIRPRNESVVIKIEGQYAIIDLGEDVSAGPWVADGDSFILDRNLGRTIGKAPWQIADLYVDGRPVSPADPRKDKTLRPGQLEHLEDGRIRVRFPEGSHPDHSKVILNAGVGVNCVGIVGSNVTVRELIALHAGNDGFNIHGNGSNITIERGLAAYCSDEGISAHGHSRVGVRDSIFAFNGSDSGGVADVNQSITTYERCASIGNRGAGFHLAGQTHYLVHCVVGGNSAAVRGASWETSNVVDLMSTETTYDLPTLDPDLRNLILKSRELLERAQQGYQDIDRANALP